MSRTLRDPAHCSISARLDRYVNCTDDRAPRADDEMGEKNA
jgi:hypothetical protein